ncbi:MAG: hypothetical protein HQL13_02250 [Candidatus Omnitrophica bacterium]|nr:hypothetical protein [Candidatus Omnitrophota bacterium]
MKQGKFTQNIAAALLCASLMTSTMIPAAVMADEWGLPKPGSMVHLSRAFNPPILKGLKVYPDDPLHFDFIMDAGTDFMSARNHGLEAKGTGPCFSRALSPSQFKQEATKLIKYFLASITVPETDLWVNLSPYEKNRIIPQAFGLTEMGRDLLAQDYLLKQISASLLYPEGEMGKIFWKRIYESATDKFKRTDVPINTFNRVWIIPEKAVVYENAKTGAVYVAKSRLKVMLEEDYLALGKHKFEFVIPAKAGIQNQSLGSKIIREVVIPELTKEVNEGKNFALLRQVYNSLILATWYKKKIKDSLLAQVYADKNKVVGTGYQKEAQKGTGPCISRALSPSLIYQRYLQAFKKGAYNYIKEEEDPLTQSVIPKKYFSGGVTFAMAAQPDGLMGISGLLRTETKDTPPLQQGKDNLFLVSEEMKATYPSPEISSSVNGANPEDYSKKELDILTEEMAREILRLRQQKPANNQTVLLGLDGPSGIGKSTIAKALQDHFKQYHPEIPVYHITLDMFLRNRAWRMAVQKWVLKEELTSRERETIAGVVRTVIPGQIYTDEESFFDKLKVKQFLRFIRQAIQKRILRPKKIIHKAYIRGEPSLKKHTVQFERGAVIIIDGKYCCREELVKFYDMRYRVLDSPTRAHNQFHARTEVLSPKTAQQQKKFYVKGLEPSWQRYDARTRFLIDRLIDLTESRYKFIIPQETGSLRARHRMRILQKKRTERRLIQRHLGGIDLRANQIQARNSGQELKFHLDPLLSRQFENISGFIPVIISIQPVQNLKAFFLNQ